MPTSEIDAIFASKGKSRPVEKVASSSTTTPTSQKKKNKKKSSHRPKDDEKLAEPKQGTKRPPPETVIDPSMQERKPKRSKSSGKDAAQETKTKSSKPDKAKEDEDRFKDSRGNGPRRQTEEGYSIYKEDELGIGEEGGDTALCPFDCKCCF